MRYLIRSLSMLMLVLVLVVPPVTAQESTPTPEGTEQATVEPTVEVTPVVEVPPSESPADQLEDLQERVDTLTNQNTILLGVVAGLFLALAIAGVYLARSVPAGTHADLLKLASEVLIKEGAGAGLTKFEQNAKLSDSQIDDIIAAIGRAGYNKLYPPVMAQSGVSGAVGGTSPASVELTYDHPVGAVANISVELTEEDDTTPKG